MIRAAFGRLRSLRVVARVRERLRPFVPWWGPTAALDRDVAFRILSSERRRNLVRVLEEYEGEEIGVSELSTLVAAAEYEVDDDAVDADQRKRIYVSLYQTHLPRMADLGLIGYDQEAGIVRPTTDSAALAAAADEADERIQREVIA